MKIAEIFRNALNSLLSHGDQTRISKTVGISVQKLNHIVSGERQGSEDDRRAIAAALGYEYENFLNLGRKRLGLLTEKQPPTAPEVAQYLAKARTVLESPDGDHLKAVIEAMSKARNS